MATKRRAAPKQRTLKSKVRARSRAELAKLKARRAAAQRALRRLGRQSAAASGPLKAGVRKAWSDLDSAVRQASRRFRSTP